MRIGLSFDDVLIIPNHHSEISSRSIPDTTTKLNNLQLKYPIIASPMDTVTGTFMLARMAELGSFAIMHKYCSPEEQIKVITQAKAFSERAANGLMGAAIGSKDEINYDLLPIVDVICIDVANGDHVDVVKQVKYIKNNFPDKHIMAGNVATSQGFHRLMDAGADSIRCGIGPGSACATRVVTAIGVPQLTAIEDCAKVADGHCAVIADGGIRNSGDICKAIAAGATACMLGSVLAGSDASPGEIQKNEDGKLFKYYRGMASEQAQRARGTEGKIVPEGVEGLVQYKGSLEDIILQFEGGLRSSMTYVNARNLTEYYLHTEFIQITSAGSAESHPHNLTLI